MTVWTVKAGHSGEREERCLGAGVIGGGWGDLVDLSDVASRDELAARYSDAYPTQPKKTVSNYVGQLWSLVSRMEDGDMIVLPVKTTGTIAVGEIIGPYKYRSDLGSDFCHTRPVKWIATDVPRDNFEQDLLYSFGAFLTFGQVRRERAEERIRAAIKGQRLNPSLVQDDDSVPAADIEEQPDISALAREQIRQFVTQRFAGHELAGLVGAILEAQGFSSVSVSPPGPDRGVDILAASGPLGLDSPKLAVQVKTGQAGVEEFRSLKGVLEEFRADQGLLVAWSGFKGSVRNEARHSHFAVRLWDADDLLEELSRVYERLPDDVRSELPLQRLWALVPVE